MSLSGALNNAITGLTAASRSAEVVSSNLANALTEGFGRREISLSSRIAGQSSGVQVNGVWRMVNPVIVGERRSAEAAHGMANRLHAHHVQIEALIGTPDNAASLAARIADFEASLIAAASQPGDALRLQAVANSGAALTGAFNAISDGIQAAREQADRNIDAMVGRLNTLLQDVEHLNKAIIAANGAGKPTMALEDARQIAVDEIATLVPVRPMPRDHGAIALYSRGGAILLEGSAAHLTFEPANVITPHHSLESGTLSGITSDSGQQLWGVGRDLLSGGAIAAEFAIRDDKSSETQDRLDSVARDLVERFQSSFVDTTISAGMAGLFTDDGAAFVPADEVGLAGRLALNTRVDASVGGDPALLRDGLYATAPGPAGDATTLQALTAALSQGDASMHGRATALVSHLGAARLASEREVSFAGAALGAAREMELSEGVDQDHEMQSLLLIEQTYAANARMIQTLDDLMQTLLRL